MYQLDEPQYLYFLLLIPALIALYVAYRIWQSKAQKAFGDADMIKVLAPQRSSWKNGLKLILGLLIITLLSLALVNPQVGTRVETVKREGVDIVFAIDVSKSMLAEDVQPSRLERAKLAISRTLDELVSDRVGIITYAGQAYPQLPITTDYGAARLFLRNINTNLIPSQGTAIGEAIELATQYFDDADQKNRLLIILSDGEDHEEGIEEAIEQARENQIRVYTVAIGTERGGPIPIYSRGGRTGFKKDQNGEVVITKLNTALLKEIADQGDGELWDGNRTRSLISKISDEIAIMEKKEFETTLFSDYEDQFQWFLAPALLLLIIELLILDRKTHWFQKLNLFNEEESPID